MEKGLPEDWDTRFRRIQEIGAEHARKADVGIEDIVDLLREARGTATPEELERAQQIIDEHLGRSDQ